MKSLFANDQVGSGNPLNLFLSSFACPYVNVRFFSFWIRAQSNANRLHDGWDRIVFFALKRAQSGRQFQHTF